MMGLSSIEKRGLIALFLVNIMIALNSEIVTPLFPLYLKSLGATVIEVGIITASAGLISAFTMIPSGLMVDRYGKRKIIILSSLLSASAIFYSLAENWGETIPITILFYVATAIFVPARMALVADYTTHKNRAMIYSIMNLAWPLGGMIGPALAGFIADLYGWDEVFYIATAISLISLIPSVRIKERSHLVKENDRPIGDVNKTGLKLRSINKQAIRIIALHTSITLLSGMANGIIFPIMPFYLTEKLLLQKTEIGLFLSLGFGVAVLIAQPASGILASKLGSKETLLLGSVFAPIAMALIPFYHDSSSLFILYMANSAFWSMSWPTSMTLLVATIPISKRGMASAVRLTGFMIGFYIGPIIGTSLWEYVSHIAPFYVAALSFALVVPIAATLKDF